MSDFADAPATAVLLGAGASVPAGVPDAHTMLDEMLTRDGLVGGFDQTSFRQVLSFVKHGLMFWEAANGREPRSPDVEQVLNVIRTLADDLNDTEPFVAVWSAHLDRFRQALIQTQGGWRQRRVAEILTDLASGKTPNQYEIDQLAKEITRSTGTGQAGWFRKLDEEALIAVRTLAKPSEPVDYLYPLVRYRDHAGTPPSIATLNYDLCVEQASQEVGVDVDSGMDAWRESEAVAFREGAVPLYKLHGSVDLAELSFRGQLSYPRWTEDTNLCSGGGYDWDRPALILGGSNKLRPAGPFLDLYVSFKRALQGAQRLIVIGYSFRDEHVNHLVHRFLRRGELIVIDLFPESIRDRVSLLNPYRGQPHYLLGGDVRGRLEQALAGHLRAAEVFMGG
ncbi:MAG: SIR2 family protein [Frankiaceae bacterium]